MYCLNGATGAKGFGPRACRGRSPAYRLAAGTGRKPRLSHNAQARMKSSASIDKDDIVEEYEYDSSELIGGDEVEGESKLSVNVEIENVGSLNSLSSLGLLLPRSPRRAASFLF